MKLKTEQIQALKDMGFITKRTDKHDDITLPDKKGCYWIQHLSKGTWQVDELGELSSVSQSYPFVGWQQFSSYEQAIRYAVKQAAKKHERLNEAINQLKVKQ